MQHEIAEVDVFLDRWVIRNDDIRRVTNDGS
jgi:hypothetical protein